ncbi:MAG TPA: DUF3011 domain-containing protein [Terriglobales bacterium]|nr:DUF3011 domain-containing protein [Terriglobales bacterium]
MNRLARFATVAVLGLLATSAAWAQFGNAQPNSGACFYSDYNFRGQSFCMNAGQDAATMPPGFNDRIRSIRVFGRAQVMYFNDSQFRGASGTTSNDINDLRQFPLPNVPGKDWNTRISSIRITGWQGRPGDFDGDGRRDWPDRRDRDDHAWHSNDPISAVRCSSNYDRDRDWCGTPGRVNSVRLVEENGRTDCQWNRTFGIDNGRLWTSRGCAGTFEIR